MSKKSVRIAVTGAAGNIGYCMLFRIASGEMFGKDTEVHFNLLEITPAMNALSGVVMELEDCAFPLLKSITATDDPNVAFKDVDWALLVGSFPRKAGMERSDLLKVNGKIFTTQGKAISDNAKPDCKVLVVGNPCNTNCYIAKASAPNIPEKNFFAMMMLDQSRAYSQIAQKAGINVTEISHLITWGNHSSTQYPDFYHAKINGKKLTEVITDEKWLQEDFMKKVQKRGAEIIQARGISSAASAANAIIQTVVNLTTPTKEGEYFSVAVPSDGSYGVEKGLMFGFPVRSDGENWEIVQGIEHNEFGKEKFETTYKELLSEKEAVKDLVG